MASAPANDLVSCASTLAETFCAFGEAAAWPVQGFLRHYWHEFEFAILNGRFWVDAQLEQPA